MKYEFVFMALVVGLEAIASGVYASNGDWRRAGIWLCYALASVLITW